jgi:hypothetical protein
MNGLEREMRYLCLVYQDEDRLKALSCSEYAALIGETLSYDEELRRSGYLLASNALELVCSAASVRVRDGRV